MADQEEQLILDIFNKNEHCHEGKEYDFFTGQNDFFKKMAYSFLTNERSKHTRLAYAHDLKQFFYYINVFFNLPKVIHQKPIFSSIKLFHINAYKEYISTKGNQGSPYSYQSIRRKLAAISKFFTFLVREDLIRDNPVRYSTRPKMVNLKETEALEALEVREIFKAIKKDHKISPLHHVIFSLLFYTGIRKSELLNIRKEDYQFRKGFNILSILGKGQKKRIIPLHPLCTRSIENYLERLASLMIEINDDDFLLQLLSRGSSLTGLRAQFITDLFKIYKKRTGIQKRITPHSARATYITRLYELKQEVGDISKEVGHVDLNTTNAYIKRKNDLEKSLNFKLDY